MITVREYQNSISLINDISRFYRDVLSGGNSIITLEKELEISRNYLKIMSTRYPGQFEYCIGVDEVSWTVVFPSLPCSLCSKMLSFMVLSLHLFLVPLKSAAAGTMDGFCCG